MVLVVSRGLPRHHRMLELERLDLLWREALRLVQTDSFQVHQGRIVDGVADEGSSSPPSTDS
jgi:hypothetical protein